MNNEKLQIDLAPGQDHAEIVLREVGNENPYKLPAKEPLNLQVDGVITCIYAFLEKRWGTDSSRCTIRSSERAEKYSSKSRRHSSTKNFSMARSRAILKRLHH